MGGGSILVLPLGSLEQSLLVEAVAIYRVVFGGFFKFPLCGYRRTALIRLVF